MNNIFYRSNMTQNMVQFCSKQKSGEENSKLGKDAEYDACIKKIREDLYKKVIPIEGNFAPISAEYEFTDGGKVTFTVKPIEQDLCAKALTMAFCNSKIGLTDARVRRFESTDALIEYLDAINDDKIKEVVTSSE